MIFKVAKSGKVCDLYQIIIWIICYADNTSVFANSIENLQAAIDIIVEYCASKNITNDPTLKNNQKFVALGNL